MSRKSVRGISSCDYEGWEVLRQAFCKLGNQGSSTMTQSKSSGLRTRKTNVISVQDSRSGRLQSCLWKSKSQRLENRESSWPRTREGRPSSRTRGVNSLFLYYFVLSGLLPILWCCPHRWWMFLFIPLLQMPISSGNTLRSISRNIVFTSSLQIPLYN
jgi:hypothetical protein